MTSLVSRLLRSAIAASLPVSRAFSASSCRTRSAGSDRSAHAVNHDDDDDDDDNDDDGLTVVAFQQFANK